MQTIEKKDNKIVFKVEMEESLANAVRRHMNQIPILAISEVEIHKNGSSLYDETIAHRLGLIPIKMDKAVNEKTVGKLKLKAKKEGMIYSGELKGNVKVVYDEVPITSLNKDQELEIVATATVGIGSEHSKFSPGLMFYRNIVEMTIDKKFSDEIKRICKDNKIVEKGDKIIIMDDGKKEICDVCEGICEKENKKAEVKPTNELIITLESFGQLSTKDVLLRTIDGLKKDLAEVSKKIGK
jgi:DNA-directed RNA polymerase subunit D